MQKKLGKRKVKSGFKIAPFVHLLSVKFASRNKHVKKLGFLITDAETPPGTLINTRKKSAHLIEHI